MQTAEIRRRFLAHFEANGHLVVPSASLVSADPTLLYVNAGMVPFKPFFLGDLPPPAPRATSVQKVVRTIDIDQVGKTSRHASFFQMCGNFSFGDYFKARAIPLAWELLTSAPHGYGFDPEKLWATVYLDDDEVFEIWTQFLPRERIQRRGKADNFWSMGVPGPCGPCSEIYFDRGSEHGADGGPEADEERYLELWNLVFMQYERGAGEGYDYPILRDLPARNIDTGMGLERMATILQDVDNLYEIDISRPVLDRAAELSGQRYGAGHACDVSLRIVSDHMRTGAMLVADGVTPSNEGRGYVLRRILRRAFSNMHQLGSRDPVSADLLATVRAVMSDIYPDLNSPVVASVIEGEEEAFRSTLSRGLSLLDTAVSSTRSEGSTQLSGERAFALHDTYGFPYELTRELAEQAGLSIDEAGFQDLMRRQRDLAKQDRRGRGIGNLDLSAYRPVLERSGSTVFTGYEELVRESTVTALLDLSTAALLPAAREGDEIGIVLDVTPFYAESGGQAADHGRLIFAGSQSQAVAQVLDVQTPVAGLIVHRARIRSGELLAGTTVSAEVDRSRRAAVSRAHTATHLVHRAFRVALGETATQAGSLNAPGRLRFDFHAPSAVPAAVVHDVEEEINEVLLRDLAVSAFVTTQDEARRLGAMALFGEKYGDAVRVVDIGDFDAPYARELCGGTHVARSAQLGAVTLLSESSVAAGTRRVEGLVGLDAFRHLARERVLLNQVAGVVKATRSEEVPERVNDVVARLREAERQLDRLRADAVLASAGSLHASAPVIGGVALVAATAPDGTGAKDVRTLAADVRGRFGERAAVVVIAAVTEGKVSLAVATTSGAREQGLSARTLLNVVTAEIGGKGGGPDDMAQGAGTEPGSLPRAFEAIEALLAKHPGSGPAR